MDFIYLEELHKLCPKITYLYIRYNGKNLENIEIVSKFEKLTSIYFGSSYETRISLEYYLKFLKSLKEENKLESILFSEVEELDDRVIEFYETLFSKVKKLTTFERMNERNFSNNFRESYISQESMIISSWIEKNSTVTNLQFNC
jgi:hypothetical protein